MNTESKNIHKRTRVIYPRTMAHQKHYCVHCRQTVPDVPVGNEKLLKKHLLEAHGMNYIEKNKVDKHVKAETHVLDTLSIAPDITIVNESVSVKKQQNSPSLLHVVRLYM